MEILMWKGRKHHEAKNNDMDEAEKHAKWYKTGIKRQYCMILQYDDPTYMNNLQKANSEIENVTDYQGWREAKIDCYYLMATI